MRLTAEEKVEMDVLCDKLLDAVIEDKDFDAYEWLEEKDAIKLEALLDKEEAN